MRKRLHLRTRYAGLVVFAAAVAVALFIVPAAFAAAVSTTDNPGWQDSYDSYINEPCTNGPTHTTPENNCNIYNDKRDVWLSGLPVSSSLGAGTYFFAVLSPGGQPTPNDGGTNNSNGELANLSDNSDSWTNREFTIGDVPNEPNQITYSGTHDFDPINNSIQLFPYHDTPNSGGVYILAVCKVPANPSGAPGVDPRDCKYDAFKVTGTSECTSDCGTEVASDLDASKTAAPSFTRTFTWGITKSACAHGINTCTQTVDALSGNVTFDYTVTLTEDGGHDTGFKVDGVITVNNGNLGAASNVVVTDTIDHSGSCSVDTDTTLGLDPTGDTLPGMSQATYPYSCSFSSDPGSGTNTGHVTWDSTLSDNSVTPDASANPTAPYSFGDPTTVNGNCVTATDTFNGGSAYTLGSFCADGTDSNVGANPAVTATWASPVWTLKYSRSIAVVANACKSYANTATFSGASVTSGLKGSDSATVTICGPVAGGLTMGFWQNKNGQGIITGQAKTGVCPSGTWLFQFAPFQDLQHAGSPAASTATCAQVATYVYNVIKAATCSTGGTCNTMLKAQMLATALDVYFSDPALGGNQIKAPAPIGGVKVDLTKICKMIDGSSGSATCSGTYSNTSAAFGGASCLTVSQLLSYAASQSNIGGSTWYGQVKATQVLAKDTFDAINNQVAFTC